MKHVALFASSCDSLPRRFGEAAFASGEALARAGYAIVYGGGNNGLMGEIARGARAAGGRLVGVIPRGLREAGFCYDEADEIIVTENLAERKRIMNDRAEAFVCLPGGIGTLDEFFTALAEKQLGFHDKPILLLNIISFYEPVSGLIVKLKESGFVAEKDPGLFDIVGSVEEIPGLLKSRLG